MRAKLLLTSFIMLAGMAFGQSQFSGGGSSSGGSGTVSSCGAAGNAFYSGSGTTVSCDTNITDNGSGVLSFGTAGILTLVNTTATNPFQLPAGSAANIPLTFGGNVAFGFYGFSATTICLGKGSANTNSNCFINSGIQKALAGGSYAFVASATDGSGAVDTGLCRLGAGVLEANAGTGCGTTGRFQASAYISAGTKFTSTGCSEVTTTGGGSAGTIATVGVTSCTDTITMGDGATAPNGWVCNIFDITTAADAHNPAQTSSTTTTATFTSGTIVSGDVIRFSCTGY